MNYQHDMEFFLHATIGLIAILDPIAAIPILLSLTRSRTADETRHIVRVVTISCAIAIFTFALLGSRILDFFGISLAAFRTSGGILILLMAIQMMQGESRKAKQTPEEQAEASEKENIAVVPLAIPLLVGPGTMSTTILLSKQANTVENGVVLLAAISVAIGVTWFCLHMSNLLRRILGETGLRIASRIMGLLLAALAVQFIADGVRELFPALQPQV